MKRKYIVPVIVILILAVLGGCITYLVDIWVEKDQTSDIHRYEEYLGKDGLHRQKYLIANQIFPETIPTSAKVETFIYQYDNPWDPNYVVYLVYTCDKNDYAQEVQRLSALEKTKDTLIYGATGFSYPVVAIQADPYHGYVYALADEKHQKLMYVEITFCNFFSDIAYQKIIDPSHLPKGFDATNKNDTKKHFEQQSEH